MLHRPVGVPLPGCSLHAPTPPQRARGPHASEAEAEGPSSPPPAPPPVPRPILGTRQAPAGSAHGRRVEPGCCPVVRWESLAQRGYLCSWSCHAVKAGTLWGLALPRREKRGLSCHPSWLCAQRRPSAGAGKEGGTEALKTQLWSLLWASTLPLPLEEGLILPPQNQGAEAQTDSCFVPELANTTPHTKPLISQLRKWTSRRAVLCSRTQGCCGAQLEFGPRLPGCRGEMARPGEAIQRYRLQEGGRRWVGGQGSGTLSWNS